MNPVRTCPFCAKSDDHPRHVYEAGGVDVAAHMDCHALAANCEICLAQLDGVGGVDGNPKGEELRKHLMTTGPSADKAGWTAPSVEEV